MIMGLSEIYLNVCNSIGLYNCFLIYFIGVRLIRIRAYPCPDWYSMTFCLCNKGINCFRLLTTSFFFCDMSVSGRCQRLFIR